MNNRRLGARFDALLDSERLIAIVRENEEKSALRYARAVLDGGVRLVEIAMTTPGALHAMQVLQKEYPEALVGAGTVTDLSRAAEAAAAGAHFIVTPNLDEEVVRFFAAQEIPVLPGVATASEIFRALRAGARAVKLFPASVYGPGFVRAVLAPLPGCRIVAVGGVNADNASVWLEAGAVGVGIGAGLAPKGQDVREAAAQLKILLRRQL